MNISLQTESLNVSIAGKQVCNALDLQINAGQCLGILGRNGIGKTTLIKTLAGLHPADNGDIKIADRSLHHWSHHALARTRGLLMQSSPGLFNGSVLEAVLIGRHPYINTWQWESVTDMEIAQQALDAVGLTDFAERQLLTLSGGEYRRVEIARLLAQDTDLLFLDEPVSHLDLHYQISILNFLQNHCQTHSRAMVMILHDPNLAARFCDQLLLLYGGGEFQYGTPDETLGEETLYRVYQHRISITRYNGECIIIPR